MKKWFKPLTIGIILGSLAMPAIGYTTSKLLNIEVAVVTPGFNIDGKVVKDESYSNGENIVPYALNYKGTTYVPVRKLGELMGKNISWDQNSGMISINSNAGANTIEYEVIKDISSNDVPKEIQDWYEQTRVTETSGVKTIGDSNYILIQRGPKPTTGYSVNITSINEQGNQVVINAHYKNPAPGMMQGQVITYPSILVKTKAWDANRRLLFSINKEDSVNSIVAGQLQPTLRLDTSQKGSVQFQFTVKNQTERVQDLTFDNGLEYDYAVRSELGQKIAEPTDYQLDKKHTNSLKQGEELKYDGTIKLNPGKYIVDFYLNDTQWKSHSTQSFLIQ